jgi:DNA polymerase III gamma/tau subunit
MVLYNKYRPGALSEMKGNSLALRSLESMIESNEVPHAVLFQGPRGCGKTTLARILAKAIECRRQDLQELDVGSFTGIEHSRQLKRNVMMKPLDGPVRVWILDEVARASKPAQDAILKTLEEPPSYAYFFLCTTDPQRLAPTLRSRCAPIHVAPLNEKQTIQLLKEICEKEKIRVPNKILSEVYKASVGHPRDALSLLETLIRLEPEEMEGAAIKEAAKRSAAINLCRAIWKKESWKIIAGILGDMEEEPETVRHKVLGYFNTILLSGKKEAAIVIEPFLKNFYDSGQAGLTMATFAAWWDLRQ